MSLVKGLEQSAPAHKLYILQNRSPECRLALKLNTKHENGSSVNELNLKIC